MQTINRDWSSLSWEEEVGGHCHHLCYTSQMMGTVRHRSRPSAGKLAQSSYKQPDNYLKDTAMVPAPPILYSTE